MEFRVGDILAKCPRCGATQFKLPDEELSGPYMKYFCASCGTSSIYADLIKQIGREHMRRKNERLAPGKQAPSESPAEPDERPTPQFLERKSND
jgi:ribosomal protein S27AE